jgi:hypothetical protein
MQAVRQLVFTDVLTVGRLDVDSQSFAHIGLHKIDASSDWLLTKHHCIGMIGFLIMIFACREFSYKINQTTAAIDVILAFTGKKMFYFNLKSEGPQKNSKTSRGAY